MTASVNHHYYSDRYESVSPSPGRQEQPLGDYDDFDAGEFGGEEVFDPAQESAEVGSFDVPPAESQEENDSASAELKAKLKALEENVTANQELNPEQRSAELKEINELFGEIEQSPEETVWDLEDEVDALKSKIDGLETLNESLKTETERSKGLENAIAQELSQALAASAAPKGKKGAGDGTLAVTLHTLGGAAGLATGLVVGNLLSETKGPKSRLKNLPPAGQKLDIIMRGNSGLAGSNAASTVTRILYDTKLSPEEQVKKLQTTLNTLPVASRAYALSTVVSLIKANDPQKIDFLSQNFPETLDYLNQTLQAGASAIESGNLTLGKSKGYKVVFKNGEYKIKNTDTSWFRNDWDNYSIATADIVGPIQDAINQLGLTGGTTPSKEAPNGPVDSAE